MGIEAVTDPNLLSFLRALGTTAIGVRSSVKDVGSAWLLDDLDEISTRLTAVLLAEPEVLAIADELEHDGTPLAHHYAAALRFALGEVQRFRAQGV